MPDLDPETSPTQQEIHRPYDKFDLWSEQNTDPEKSTLDNLNDYRDYVRESLLEVGQYSLDAEAGIQTGYQRLLGEHGLIDPDSGTLIPDAQPTVQDSFDKDFEVMRAGLTAQDSEFDVLSQYNAQKPVVEAMDQTAFTEEFLADPANAETAQYLSDFKELEAQVRETTSNADSQNKVRRRLISSGDIGFAEVAYVDEEGNTQTEIVVGDHVTKENGQAAVLDAVRKGTIPAERVPEALSLLEEASGYGRPIHQVIKGNQVTSNLHQLLTEDPNLSERYSRLFQDYTDHLGKLDRGEASGYDEEYIVEQIARDLNTSGTVPEGDAYTVNEVRRSLQHIGANNALATGAYEYYDDPAKVGDNIRVTDQGDLIAHPALMVNKEKFEEAVAARPDLTDAQITRLRQSRQSTVNSMFDQYNEILQEGQTGEDWVKFRAEAKEQGMSQGETLEAFLADGDNFSEAQARLGGVGASILDGFTELATFIPALAGNEWSQDHLAKNAEQRANRRELARAFGVEFGMGQDIAEAIAPMAIDLTATALLAAPTGGASAGLFALKTGGKMTAKGITKGLILGGLKETGTETAEQLALKAVTRGGVFKSSTSVDDAMNVIKGYNKFMQSSTPALPAMFVTAANRSGAATFGATYNAMLDEYGPDITPEQKQKALDTATGAALTSAAITGTITTAMAGAGAGGVEKLILAGATKGQVRKALANLAGVDDISNEAFKKIVENRLKQTTAKQLGVGLVDTLKQSATQGTLRSAGEEAVEEGLDTFLGTIGEAIYMGDDTVPFMDLAKQTWHAAAIGGALGAGAPMVQKGAERFRAGGFGRRQLQLQGVRRAEDQFIQDITNDLNETGSPATAEMVDQILRSGRGRVNIVTPTGEVSRAEAEDRLMATAVDEEVAQVEEAIEVSTVNAVEAANGQSEFGFVAELDDITAPKRPLPAPDLVPVGTPEVQDEFDFEADPQREFGFAESMRPNSKKTSPFELPKPDLVGQPDTDVGGELVQGELDFSAEQVESLVKAPEPSEADQQLEFEFGPEAQRKAPARMSATQRQAESEKSTPTEKAKAKAAKKVPTKKAAKKAPTKKAAKKKAAPQKATRETAKVEQPAEVIEDPKTVAPQKAARPAYMVGDTLAVYRKTEGDELNEWLDMGELIDVQDGVVTVLTMDGTVEYAVSDVSIENLTAAEESAAVEAESEVADNSSQGASIEDTNELLEAPTTPPVKKVAKKKTTKKATKKTAPKKDTPDPAPLSTDLFEADEIGNKEYAIANATVQLGYPARFTNTGKYGFPVRKNGGKGYFTKFSDAVAEAIRVRYPVVPPSDKNKFRRVDNNAGDSAWVSREGNELPYFDNDPLHVAELISIYGEVLIPNPEAFTLNPSIKIARRGGLTYAVDVVSPDVKLGTSLPTSAVKPPEFMDSVTLNYSTVDALTGFGALFDNEQLDSQMLPNTKGTSAKNQTVEEVFGEVHKLYLDFSNMVNTSNRDFKSIKNTINSLRQHNKLTRQFLRTPTGRDLFLSNGDTIYMEQAAQAFLIEYKAQIRLLQLRIALNKMLDENGGLKVKDQTAINAVSKFFVGHTKEQAAAVIARSFPVKDKDNKIIKVSPNATILNFIHAHVLGVNPNRLPNMRTIGSRVVGRYAEHMDRRNLFDRARREDSIHDENNRYSQGSDSLTARDWQTEEYANSVGPEVVGIGAEIDAGDIAEMVGTLYNMSVRAIDSDPEMRGALDNLLIAGPLKGVMTKGMDIESLPTEVVLGRLSQWFNSASWENNPEALDFRKRLRDGSLPSARVFDSYLSMIASSAEFDNAFESRPKLIEFRDAIIERSGKQLNEEQIKQVERAIIREARKLTKLNAKSYIDEGKQAAYRESNHRELSKLGLLSGDPESVITALNNIVADQTYKPYVRAAAKIILKAPSLVRNVNIMVIDADANVYGAGEYSVDTDGQATVTLNMSGHNGQSLASVVVHEYLHALTSHGIRNPETLTTTQRAAIQTLESARQDGLSAAQESGITDPRLLDGLVNLDEFVAHMFTSSKFQQKLKEAGEVTAKKEHFFRRALNALLKFLGLEKARQTDAIFDALIDLSYGAAQTEPKTSAARHNELSVSAADLINNATDRQAAFDEALQEIQQATGVTATSFATSPEVEVVGDRPTDRPVEKLQAIESDIMQRVFATGVIPHEVETNISYEVAHPAWMRNGKVYINPLLMNQALLEIPTEVGREAIVRAVLEEEVDHVASVRAISEEEFTAYKNELTDADYEAEGERYYSDPSYGLPEEPEAREEQKRMLAEERLRSYKQQVMSGTTTEEVVEFFRQNRTSREVAAFYFKQIIARMMSRFKINQFSGREQALIQAMVGEVRRMNRNYRRPAPFTGLTSVDQLESEVGTFTQQLHFHELEDGVELLPDAPTDRAFWNDYSDGATEADISPTSFGSEIPQHLASKAFNFSAYKELIHMPLLEEGGYAAPSKLLHRMTRGEFDPRVRMLMNQRGSFERASRNILTEYKEVLDKAVAADERSPETLQALIQTAIGSTDASISRDAQKKIDEDYFAKLDKVDDRIDKADVEAQRDDYILHFPNMTESTATNKAMHFLRKVERAKILNEKTAQEDAVRQQHRDDVIKSRNRALEDIVSVNQPLGKAIVDLRILIDDLSKIASETISGSTGVDVNFDSQLGIYVTRAYRMFDDMEYRADLTDPTSKGYNTQEMHDIRQAADAFFESEFVKHETEKGINNGLTQAEAEAEAHRLLNSKTSNGGKSYGEQAREAFLASYDPSGRGSMLVSDPEMLKVVDKNLRQRKELDPAIRQLLGEYDAAEGTNNLLRTFATVTSLIASHKLLSNVKELGSEGSEPWIHPPEWAAGQTEGDIAALGFKEIKVPEGHTSAFNPLQGHYAPAEFADAVARTATATVSASNADAATNVIQKIGQAAVRLTGQAQAFKVLGSVGHFFRNGLSQGFMAAAQGRPLALAPDMIKAAGTEVRTLLPREMQNLLGRDGEIVDAKRLEYIQLGVVGDEVRAGILKELLSGKRTVDSIQEELIRIHKGDTATEKGKGVAGTAAGAAKLLAQKAGELESATEAFYKIAYYENTLTTLKKAKAQGGGTLRGVPIDNMSELDLKREAAEQVQQTTPSFSRTMPIVSKFSQSAAGVLVAPFVRWKSEMIRTPVGTYQLAMAEIKSGNEVLVARGRARMIGMSSMIVMSGMGPAIASMLFAGMSDEEDEALRDSLPEYLRTHSFIYYRDGEGKLWSIDLTYTNPFSAIGDPLARSMSELGRGRPDEAIVKAVDGFISSQFLDNQILSGAVMSLRSNTDSTTGMPIYYAETDSPAEIAYKATKYIVDKAFVPRLGKDLFLTGEMILTDADYDKTDKGPARQLMDGIYPFKRHQVDVEQQQRRYLFQAKETYDAVISRKYKAMSNTPMSEAEVAALYHNETKNRMKVNADVYRKLRGFEGLGIDASTSLAAMKAIGMGDRRSRLIFSKAQDRVLLSPKFTEKLMAKEFGPERLHILLQAQSEYPAVILFD